jgi:hypothetical protein
MKSINFIKSELVNFHKNLNLSELKIHIKYEFLDNYNSHLVEILPFDFFDSDAVVEFRYDLNNKFEELFSEEELIFISENSLNKISNILFEIKDENNDFKKFAEYSIFNPVDLYFKSEKDDLFSNLLDIEDEKIFIPHLSIGLLENFGYNDYALAA